VSFCSTIAERCGSCIHSDLAGHRVVEMIVHHAEPAEIARVLCEQVGDSREDRQVAFFALDGDAWHLMAYGDLTAASAAALARFAPGEFSDGILDQGCDQPGLVFDDGWACHLFSWTGELLGMFVRFADSGAAPSGLQASRIEATCRLASLAIEQKNVLDELAHQADHDPVTGLLTRTCFEKLLAWRLKEEQGPALLCINLDRFRMLNDVLGYAIGNRILKLTSLRFQSCLGSRDILARAGGDEFVVLLEGTGNSNHAISISERLLHSLDEPFCIEAHELYLTAGIGIAYAGADSTPESLQHQAGTAIYHAKQQGKSQWVQFSSSMTLASPERLEMEKRLRSALSRNEMLLHYQPQIDLTSGLMTGVEALLRWKPEGLGVISPASFIPILEETGIIADFGSWVLREACLQGQRWVRAGLPLRVAVNVSALQFARPGFVGEVRRILAETGFSPGLLELELTETVVIREYQQARDFFEELQELGVLLALDDFGTGQSSLAHVQNLPFQRLKIDRSFVCSLSDDPKSALMAESIIRMASSLGMRALAEGIDRAEQLEMLIGLGCQEAQGFFLSTPLPADGIAEFAAGRGHPA
jgi:diguanylate cyclase (GGDEF)-like protein